MEPPLLQDLLIIFILAIGVLLACHRLKIPSLVGLLITGIIAGPYGFGLVKAVDEVEVLAEIGVVLLLFTIGIDFSLKKLLQIKKTLFVGGAMQVALTTMVVAGVAAWQGRSASEAVFYGFLVSLSSTAIVLHLLREKAEVDSLHGRTSLGILIFQDLIIVPMILITPMLAGKAGEWQDLVIFLAKGTGIIAIVIVASRWLIPGLLYQITRTRSRELFLLCVAVICFGIAWLTAEAGLSLALGAFLAGLIISESEYGYHALGNVIPFRDIFASLFFVSIGMLLDLGFFFDHPLTIAFFTLGVLLIKILVCSAVALILGLSPRTSLLVGLALPQIGEFSFVLSRIGQEFGYLAGEYQYFLAVAILTMALSPFLLMLSSPLGDFVSSLPFSAKLLNDPLSSLADEDGLSDHLVIIGFGLNGRNVARAARLAGIPYVVIESAPETVRTERQRGEPIFYGDATHAAVLEHANIEQARVAVVAIADPAAIRRITATIKRINPAVHLIVRSQYVQEMPALYALGANEVIPEEFETSIEIFVRALHKYLVPQDEVDKLVVQIRADGYQMLRVLSGEALSSASLQMYLPEVKVATFRVSSNSEAVGKNLADIGLRKKYGVTALAVQRQGGLIFDTLVDLQFCPDDLLYVIGKPVKLLDARGLFEKDSRPVHKEGGKKE